MKIESLLLSVATLFGCKAHQDSLDRFVEDLHREVQIEVSLPAPIFSLEVSSYSAHHVRPPFALPINTNNQHVAEQNTCPPAPSISKVGHFNQFSLAELSFKGVISIENHKFALVQAPSGYVAKLAIGERLGSSNAEIMIVTEQDVLLKESVSDGGDCWHQRDVKLQRQ